MSAVSTDGRAAAAERHVRDAEREAADLPGLGAGVVPRPVGRVGIVGAGTMGRGIAIAFANAGLPVVLVDASQAALDRGLATVRDVYATSVARGRIEPAVADARIAAIRGSLDLAAVADCDLVVEAVFEDLAAKRQVCARLGATCRPGAIIATNTSTLDVDALAEATGRAADVVGLHFFSPAHVMRLLEVVRGAATAPDVLATAMRVAHAIGKVAVVSGVCYGFIGNRMAEVYMREAEFLLMEGATPADVDGAVEALGMAMGPCRMLDLAGVDVGAKTVVERGKAGGLPADPAYRAMVRRLYALGRHGQKTGVGYYRYEGRDAIPDPETDRIAAALAADHGIARRERIDAREIVERLLYPLVDEAARILDEGIALRPGDIDVVWTAGYGFPRRLGGPVHWADTIGLSTVVDGLTRQAASRGDPYGYWRVSPLLADLAARGRPLSTHRPERIR